jgi:hypothetical protein
MKIAVVSSIWRRHKLAGRCFRYLSQTIAQQSVHDIDFFCAGSEGDASRAVAEKYGYHYVEFDNDDLWRKWQAAVDLTKGEYDLYVILGSDNIVTSAYFDVAAVMVRHGALFVQPDAVVFYDGNGSKKMSMMPRGFDGGAGRIFSHELFERMEGQLYRQNPLASIDFYQRSYATSLTRPYERRILPINMETPWQLVDIKTGDGMQEDPEAGMWPFSKFDAEHNPMCTAIETTKYTQLFFEHFEWHRPV